MPREKTKKSSERATAKRNPKNTQQPLKRISWLGNAYEINDLWHPLSGGGLEFFKCNNFTVKAVNIIERSQKIWNCSPDDEKFKFAQKIWEIIVPFNKRYSHIFPSLANPLFVDVSTVPQKCKDIISKVRNHYGIDIENTTDSEIAALFAINWSCKVLEDYQLITETSLKMEYNRMFLENDLLVAETILGWAVQDVPVGGAPEIKQQKNDKKHKIKIPPSTKWSDVQMRGSSVAHQKRNNLSSEATSFLSNYPEIDYYLDNFAKGKKYLLLQGGTQEQQEIIFDYVFKKVLDLDSPDKGYCSNSNGFKVFSNAYRTPQYSCHLKSYISYSYNFCSYSLVDCLNTKDNKIFDMIYDNTDEDLKHIQEILSKILSLVMVVKQGDSQNNFDFTRLIEEMKRKFENETLRSLMIPYEIGEGRNIKTGSFTSAGLNTIINDINDMLKSESTISSESMVSVLMEKFYEDHFTKLRIVKLLDVSRENKFGLGPKETRPGFVFATVKKGENVKYLMPMYRKLFKVILLDDEGAVVVPAKEVVAAEVKSEGIQQDGKAKQSDEQDITSKPLFMDIKMNVLYFNEKTIVSLRPEQINLINYMCNQENFELEQILAEHFEIELTGSFKHPKNKKGYQGFGETIYKKPNIEEKRKAISKGDRNNFDNYKTTINNKCKPLGIGDLIIKHEKLMKVFKLSRKIVTRCLKMS